MSKVNTLFSYFQKTPAREKKSDPVGEACKIDDNANIQSPSVTNRAVSSTRPVNKRSPAKLSGSLSRKSSGSRDGLAQIGKRFRCTCSWHMCVAYTCYTQMICTCSSYVSIDIDL